MNSKFIKGGAVLGASQVVGQLCSLGRNIIIARLISPADFGIAAIFLMAVSFLEMVSNLSMDRLLVQAPDGDDEGFQQTGHFLQAIRGGISAVVLVVLAKPVATLFSIPETAWAFYLLALIPLLNGCCHLDPRRVERDMRFWPYASIEITSQALLLVLAWPVGKWLGDYRAMLLLLIIKIIVMMFGSHLVAERTYGWARNKAYIHRFFSFGWPLLINGLLMFAILQGDRFVIASAKKIFGTAYTMADVGLYSSAFLITMIPAMMVMRISASLFLPVLSREKDTGSSQFNTKITLLAQLLAVITIAFATVMILSGDTLLVLVYGDKYQVAGVLVGWLSVMWAVRMMRVLPTIVAMAHGKTRIVMNSNVWRMFGLLGCIVAVTLGLDLVWIVISGAVGELIALCSVLLLNRRYLGVPYEISTPSVLVAISCVSVTWLLAQIFQSPLSVLGELARTFLVLVGAMMISVSIFSELRNKCRKMIVG